MSKKSCCLYPFLSLVFLVLLFLGLPTVFGLIFPDDETVNDSDLTLSVISVPDEENTYFDTLLLKDLTTTDEIDAEIVLHLSGEKWDDAFVEGTLATYEKTLEVFAEAGQKTYFQDPATADPSQINLQTAIPTWTGGPNTARLNSLKAIALMKEGKEAEAFKQAFYAIQLGETVQASQTILITKLIGQTVTRIGLETVVSLVNLSTDSEQLQKTIEDLLKLPSMQNSMIAAYKVEYYFGSSMVDFVEDAVAEDPSEVTGLSQIPNDFAFIFTFLQKIGSSYYFHPKETKNDLAEVHREFIRLLEEKSCDEGAYPTGLDFEPGVQFYFTKTAFGLLLEQMVTPRLSEARICRTDLYLSAVQTLTAIKAYTLDNRALPESLEDLVHTYLPSLPEDPFGETLLYSKDKKIIYSVGSDGVDSGGSEGEKWEDMEDPTFPIEL